MAISQEKGASWSITMTPDERLMLHAVADAENVSAAEWVRGRVRETFQAMPLRTQAMYKMRAEERARGRK